jgi:hypothetical protein
MSDFTTGLLLGAFLTVVGLWKWIDLKPYRRKRVGSSERCSAPAKHCPSR